MSDQSIIITEISGAILGIAGLLVLIYKAVITPRLRVFENTLARIEKRLADLNGSVSDAVAWRHSHEIEHARSDTNRPTERKSRRDELE